MVLARCADGPSKSTGRQQVYCTSSSAGGDGWDNQETKLGCFALQIKLVLVLRHRSCRLSIVPPWMENAERNASGPLRAAYHSTDNGAPWRTDVHQGANPPFFHATSSTAATAAALTACTSQARLRAMYVTLLLPSRFPSPFTAALSSRTNDWSVIQTAPPLATTNPQEIWSVRWGGRVRGLPANSVLVQEI
ncbi:hypothetical protein AUP68_12328 [Ilyonectria robusta]